MRMEILAIVCSAAGHKILYFLFKKLRLDVLSRKKVTLRGFVLANEINEALSLFCIIIK
jgi:hypothetical protein